MVLSERLPVGNRLRESANESGRRLFLFRLLYHPLRDGSRLFGRCYRAHLLIAVCIPVAKSVADCFRFRHRIGVNIAVKALRDAWQNKKVTSDELWRCATVCRVLNVLRPYFDSLA